jgi:cysteine synthase A
MENVLTTGVAGHTGILSTIGNTPLVPLTRVFDDVPFRLYAKLEMFNPGGSTKDRTALSIIENASKQGFIRKETTVIESSSGNMAIGLAQVCAFFCIKFICVVDVKTTSQNIAILKAYGAQVDVVTEPSQETGEFLHARLQRVQDLLHTIPDSFWPDQYSNLHNPLAHRQTMHEITTQLQESIDYLFIATSTCGTMRGCAEYVREHQLGTQIIAVDAEGSAIFRNEQPTKRLIPGHGAAVRPPLYQPTLANNVIYVSDLDCVVGCHRLLKREAILAGGSSGAVMTAIERMKNVIPAGANCVAILCDRGERYLDTVYQEDWVRDHFGDVQSFWQD